MGFFCFLLGGYGVVWSDLWFNARCGLLVVCAQICGLMVKFLGGGCLFPLFQIWFLGWLGVG